MASHRSPDIPPGDIEPSAREARRQRHHAGWIAPGPPAAHDPLKPRWRPGPDETLDALVGDWRLYQLRRGNRYTTDDLLLAWFAATVASQQADARSPDEWLELGAGIGSIALMLAWRFPAAHVVALEAQPESCALARRSADFNGAGNRLEVCQMDLRSGLRNRDRGRFDAVVANPPYYAAGTGTLSHYPQRGPCRFELRGGLDAYARAAADGLRTDGLYALIIPTAALRRAEAAADAACLVLAVVEPVILKAGRSPERWLHAYAHRGRSECGTALRPPLVLRDHNDQRTDGFRAIRLAMGFPPTVA